MSFRHTIGVIIGDSSFDVDGGEVDPFKVGDGVVVQMHRSMAL